MSWREILGGTSIPNASISPQNSHNEQNPENQGNCANTANTARLLSRESALLEEALADACENPTITLQKIAAAITAADEESWQKDRIGDAALKAFTDSLTERVEINLGTRPSHYIRTAYCKYCGPIWLWFDGHVLGCPWCWNRFSGKPIPRPENVQCAECCHFRRIDHPRLGHCAANQPEPPAGLWDGDKRMCQFFIPQMP